MASTRFLLEGRHKMKEPPKEEEPLFPRFRQLPAEIRINIWTKAILAGTSERIHYYELFRHNRYDYRISRLREMLSAQPDVASLGYAQIIMPPRQLVSLPEDECDWTKSNRLANVTCWNVGIQLACWESYQIFREYCKKYLKDNHKYGTQGTIDPPYLKPEDNDIYCLRFAPEDLEASRQMDWGYLCANLPFYSIPDTVINLALEFDDSWIADLMNSYEKMTFESSTRGLALRACQAWCYGELPMCARLYLIDRSGACPPWAVDGNGRNIWWPTTGRTLTDGTTNYWEYSLKNGISARRQNALNVTVPILRFLLLVGLLGFRQKYFQRITYRVPARLPSAFFRVLLPQPPEGQDVRPSVCADRVYVYPRRKGWTEEEQAIGQLAATRMHR